MAYVNIKIGSTYTVALIVADSSGIRILNDAPSVIIQRDDGTYFNGFAYSSEEVAIALSHASNGLYTYNFKVDFAGIYTITAYSDTYRTKSITSLTATTDYVNVSYVLPNSPCTFSLKSTGTAPTVSLFREYDFTYLQADSSWKVQRAVLNMTLADGQYSFTFTPTFSAPYILSILDSDAKTTIVTFVPDSNATEKFPVLVTSSTFANNDGTNSVVLDALRKPITGAEILCYEVYENQQKLIAKATTDSDGKWSMSVPSGKYYFMFKADGYISKGFERKV